MAYQSSFTGAQVDSAVSRVTNNEFPDVQTSALDVTYNVGMTVASGESKYLSKNFVLDGNSYYLVEINLSVTPLVGTDSSPIVVIDGQDIGNGTGIILGRGDGTGTAAGSRTALSVPGFFPTAGAYANAAEEDLPRQIYYSGYVKTGAAPECRFYSYAPTAAEAYTFNGFDVKFTKVRSVDVQATNATAPLTLTP